MYSLMCKECEFCGERTIKNVRDKKMKVFDCKNKKIKRALALEQMSKNIPAMDKIITGEWCSGYKKEGHSDDIIDTLLKMQEEADEMLRTEEEITELIERLNDDATEYIQENCEIGEAGGFRAGIKWAIEKMYSERKEADKKEE